MYSYIHIYVQLQKKTFLKYNKTIKHTEKKNKQTNRNTSQRLYLTFVLCSSASDSLTAVVFFFVRKIDRPLSALNIWNISNCFKTHLLQYWYSSTRHTHTHTHTHTHSCSGHIVPPPPEVHSLRCCCALHASVFHLLWYQVSMFVKVFCRCLKFQDHDNTAVGAR